MLNVSFSTLLLQLQADTLLNSLALAETLESAAEIGRQAVGYTLLGVFFLLVYSTAHACAGAHLTSGCFASRQIRRNKTG